jgi:hypothetical protein
MTEQEYFSFKAKIDIIGVNPFVLIPDSVLKKVFKQAGKDKGQIPVKMKIDGHHFIQTLVKYSGHWRLYLNSPMRKAANKDVGDVAIFHLTFDPDERLIPMHPKLELALKNNKEAWKVFDKLPASRKKEIIRYISFLKTEESVDRNVVRAIDFLLQKQRFIGRDKP